MGKHRIYSYLNMKTKITRVDEEKLLNEMFVTLEYADTFYEFVTNISKDAYEQLKVAMKLREIKDDDRAGIM
jgi:hypothetical protein